MQPEKLRLLKTAQTEKSCSISLSIISCKGLDTINFIQIALLLTFLDKFIQVPIPQ